MDSGANDLRAKYLEALQSLKASPQADAEEIWRLFAEHSWFQLQLRVCAQHALKMFGAPLDWCGDVEHDALLILASKLRRSPDLHIDPTLAESHFAG